MSRSVFCRARAGFVPLLFMLTPLAVHASGNAPINGQDVNGQAVAVNGHGHYTVVMYTNPDLEDESRAMTLALDPFRGRNDFALIRVVDLRGDVPPQMRGIVRGQIRKEMVRENKRLEKQRGIVDASSRAPIIPDFSGSTLDALGWSSTYSQVRVVVYDEHGKEIKRLADMSDPKELTKVMGEIL
jgi:hypothetical protein